MKNELEKYSCPRGWLRGVIVRELQPGLSSDVLDFSDAESLPKVLDVEGLVKKYDQEFGTVICKSLQSGVYGNKERQALVRVVVDEVIKISGNCYPSKEVLISVAKAIIVAFPALRSKTFREGYEHFCDPKTGWGYLSFRLKNMRRYLPPAKKKRNTFFRRKRL